MTGGAFIFDTEFTRDGQVLPANERAFYSRDEVSSLSQKARSEGEHAAQDQGVAALRAFAARIDQVHAELIRSAEAVREEAAELALAAARQIAGAALDKNGEQVAAEAIADAVRSLKSRPSIVVRVPASAIPVLKPRLEQLQEQGAAGGIRIEEDATAQPGDWRIEWAEGAQGFDRDAIAEAVGKAVRDRLNDPLGDQFDLFSAA